MLQKTFHKYYLEAIFNHHGVRYLCLMKYHWLICTRLYYHGEIVSFLSKTTITLMCLFFLAAELRSRRLHLLQRSKTRMKVISWLWWWGACSGDLGVLSSLSLPLLLCKIWPEVVVDVLVLSMGQIELLKKILKKRMCKM